MNKSKTMNIVFATQFLNSLYRHEETRHGVKEVSWSNNGGSMVAFGNFSSRQDFVSINKTEDFEVTTFWHCQARQLCNVGIKPKQPSTVNSF